MKPRWAEKLEAQNRPPSNPLADAGLGRAYVALFGFIGLVAFLAGRLGAITLLRAALPTPLGMIAAALSLSAIAAGCWFAAKRGGYLALGCCLFGIVAFLGGTVFHLVLALK